MTLYQRAGLVLMIWGLAGIETKIIISLAALVMGTFLLLGEK